MAEEPDPLFEDAVEALRQGDQPRAKEIFTRLLKTDQNNANYWVWMSGAVDSPKERIYCLETALKLDPKNGVAKRGLVLFGALAPDEKIQPFPLNRPRAWEEKLLLEYEKPKESGMRAAMSNPVMRLAGVLVVGFVVVGLAVYGLLGRRTAKISPGSFSTAGPSPTYTLTPTFANATGAALSTKQQGPTPLAVLMGVSYTATPLYVNTPRAPISQDIFIGARSAFQRGDWDQFISSMNSVSTTEPTAADVPYYIGEAYRFKGQCSTALTYYNNSLKIDSKFAPGYLGLARARICMDKGANTTQLYDLALQYDPNYGEVYLDRANFNLVRKDFNAALPDLEKASGLMPDSALVEVSFAQAYLLQGNNTKALEAAQKANSIDLTLLSSYYYLGAAFIANGQYQDAIKPLQVYLIYQPKDGAAYTLLGQAFTKTGDYKPAVDALTQGLKLDPNQVKSYTYLGVADLGLNDLDNAAINFRKALSFFPDSFDANIGLTETLYRNGTFGNSYLQAETSKSKATNSTQLALAIYWRALSQEGRGSLGDAIADWKTLLAMPADAMTPDMRKTAEDHLKSIVTATNTPKPSNTPVVTRTPKVSITPTCACTGTPAGSGTPTPATPTTTLTLTPTATKKP
jgi:tetratricopeptide (TPR) repeat protein